MTPKQIGIIHNERVAVRLARLLQVMSYIFLPFIFIISTISGGLTRLTGGEPRPKVTAEGLRHLARYAGRTGILNQLHASIVKNAIRSHDVRVEAIMTHRTKIVSLEKRESAAAALDAMLSSGFSRFPVYDSDPEYIVGDRHTPRCCNPVTAKWSRFADQPGHDRADFCPGKPHTP